MKSKSFQNSLFVSVYESPLDQSLSVVLCDSNKVPVELLEHCINEKDADERKGIFADYYNLIAL